MSVILGSGEHRYRVVENWAKLPDGWEFKDVARGRRRQQGPGLRLQPRRASDDGVRPRRQLPALLGRRPVSARARPAHRRRRHRSTCTDDGGHVVRKCTTDGKVLLELGMPGKPAPYMSGEPFHRCTHTALSPKGEIYVSDGYGNANVHKYSPDGKLPDVLGRARHRSRPVQHRAQHRHRRRRLGLRRRPREPSRAGVRRQRQVRDAVEQHAPAVRPVLLPRATRLELHHRRAGPGHAGQSRAPEHRPARLHRRQARARDRAPRRRGRPGPGAGKFIAPHGIASTRAATSTSAKSATPTGRRRIPDQPIPKGLRSLQKLEKVQ